MALLALGALQGHGRACQRPKSCGTLVVSISGKEFVHKWMRGMMIYAKCAVFTLWLRVSADERIRGPVLNCVRRSSRAERQLRIWVSLVGI